MAEQQTSVQWEIIQTLIKCLFWLKLLTDSGLKRSTLHCISEGSISTVCGQSVFVLKTAKISSNYIMASTQNNSLQTVD